MISPYDKSVMQAIEKAIQTSDLGLTPSNDGKVVRKCPLYPGMTCREHCDVAVDAEGDPERAAQLRDRYRALLESFDQLTPLTSPRYSIASRPNGPCTWTISRPQRDTKVLCGISVAKYESVGTRGTLT